MVQTIRSNAIRSTIPYKWKEIIRISTKNINTEIRTNDNMPYIKIRQFQKPITRVSSKDIYKELILKKVQQPTAINKWIEIYPFLESANWTEIYKTSFRVITEPYLQSFQYKILNRLLNCKDRLHIWGLAEDCLCDYCQQIDTIEHHLYECVESKKIWTSLERWILEMFEFSFPFTICEILFGIPLECNEMDLLNFLIILVKKFINNNKSNNEPLHFILLLEYFKEKVDCLVYIYNSKDQSPKDWITKLACAL